MLREETPRTLMDSVAMKRTRNARTVLALARLKVLAEFHASTIGDMETAAVELRWYVASILVFLFKDHGPLRDPRIATIAASTATAALSHVGWVLRRHGVEQRGSDGDVAAQNVLQLASSAEEGETGLLHFIMPPGAVADHT